VHSQHSSHVSCVAYAAMLAAGTLMVAVGDHLTALKHKLDSEFGTSLLDMQSFLRTEKDAMAAASEGQLCGGATLSFVQMTQQVTCRFAYFSM
jgi:hypothetical protein